MRGIRANGDLSNMLNMVWESSRWASPEGVQITTPMGPLEGSPLQPPYQTMTYGEAQREKYRAAVGASLL